METTAPGSLLHRTFVNDGGETQTSCLDALNTDCVRQVGIGSSALPHRACVVSFSQRVQKLDT